MADTIPARFLAQAKTRPSHPAYVARKAGVWKTADWKSFVTEVRQATRALVKLGFEPGSKAVILGGNRPEWTVLDMAAMCAGGVPVGIYVTSSPVEVRYVVDHSEAIVALVDSVAQWEKIRSQRENLPRLKRVVFMQGVTTPDDPLALSWEAFLALAADVEESVVDERVSALKLEQPATFIYTSGTTGPPKAVMLSHGNLAWTALSAMSWTKISQDDRLVSYLPLSHIAEQLLSILGPATAGYTIWYAQSLEKLREDLVDAHPTVLFGVPRVWEKFHEALTARFAQATGFRRSLLAWARRTATAANAYRMRGESPPPLLGLQHRLAQRLVFSKILAALGLDQGHTFVSGAAPIARDVLDFFASIDLLIQEVYGQSEDTGPTSFNMAGRIRFGTVGEAIGGVGVRIAEDGEVMVRGPNVFLGYYKDETATRESITDGWLHSGDLGEVDAQGFLHITGRKKEIIITAGGKNITPNNIEEALKTIPLISDAIVIGDRRKYLVALFTLQPDEVKRAGSEAAVKASLDSGIAGVNEHFSRVEQIRRFHVLPTAFSIDGGELTPTMKLRRKIVAQKYEREIEALYAQDAGRD